MFSADEVELSDDLYWSSAFAVECDGDSVIEFYLNILRLVGSFFWRACPLVNFWGRLSFWILECATFYGSTPKILVDSVRVPKIYWNRYCVFLRVLNLFLSGEVPFSSGCNDLQCRIVGLDRNLESHLVVALSSTSMSYTDGSFFVGEIDKFASDEGSSQGRAYWIFPFVQSVGFDCWEDVVFDELSLHVEGVMANCANVFGFGFYLGEVICLADV